MAMLPHKNPPIVAALRDHPRMRRGIVSNWPPVWTHPTKEGAKTINGEVGVLRYVHSTDQASKKCYLVTEYDRDHYVGALLFDDSTFCGQISALLQHHLGRSIKEIGDLEVSITPEINRYRFAGE